METRCLNAGRSHGGLQSALVLICLRAEGAEEEGAAVVEGVRRGRDGGHAVAGINKHKRLQGMSVCLRRRAGW